MQLARLTLRLTLGLASVLIATLAGADEAADHFESKVRPLLAANCFRCHGDKRQQGRLRLDSRQAILAGGKSGPAAVEGAPDQSLLIQVVEGTHARLKMPPKQSLPPYEIEALARWVSEGLVWPKVPANVLLEEMTVGEAERNFWSFRPVTNPSVPDVAEGDWSTNPVDAFVRLEQQEHDLVAGPLADKRTLIRRATFDLTGLPPTPDEVAAFLADERPTAFAAVIDRLLESRHYGERWGRHWLDLVRYADTAGDASDYPIPEAYKYRDYVIESFNSDKPYDDFIREQIAGDLLPYENSDQHWQQTIATGYLAISRRIGVSPHGLRHITIEDTINNLGKTFLGLTVGCARCHDHKFDAIPTSDYYALYGIFDSSVYPHPGEEKRPQRKDFVYRMGQDEAAELLKPYREKLEPWNQRERDKFAEYQRFQEVKITDPTRTRAIVWKELQDVRDQRRAVAESFPDLEIAYAMQEGDPHDVTVQIAGDPKPRSQGPLVRRGFLQVAGGQQLPADAAGSGRRELAEWIADASNPLTARVMVNRIWHYHFGQGLVRTTSDFGVRGTEPSHPELLDFLAATFIEQGWSIKQMHRVIMLSRTYQLASSDSAHNSERDPQNHYLWRANRRRLDAEQIRDSILCFAGRLDTAPAGRHPFPHRLTYFYRQHEPFQERYSTSHRSVYMMQQRIQKDPYLDLFDGPDGNLHQGARKATTTTLQALYLMNSQFMHTQSGHIAASIVQAAEQTSGRVALAYQMIFGRPPREEEVERAETYLREFATQSDTDWPAVEQLAWSGYVRGMLSSNAFMFVD